MQRSTEKGYYVRHWKVWQGPIAGIAIAATLSMTATACGKRSEGSSGGGKHITIGVLQGWAEDQVTSELWKQVLDKKGYDVTLKNIPDAGADVHRPQGR